VEWKQVNVPTSKIDVNTGSQMRAQTPEPSNTVTLATAIIQQVVYLSAVSINGMQYRDLNDSDDMPCAQKKDVLYRCRSIVLTFEALR
jgi:hypothetical protein